MTDLVLRWLRPQAQVHPGVGGPLRLLALFALASLLLWTLCRGALVALHSSRIDAVAAGPDILWLGLRVDLITLGWALAPPLLLLPLCRNRAGTALWYGLARLWLLLFVAAAVLLEAASPAFLAEYEVRPNRLFYEYLGRPQEVLPMLWGGFRGALLSGTVLTVAASVLAWRALGALRPQRPLARRQLWLWPLLVLLCALMIRSSLLHRPANPALFARWDDTLVNQVALNGVYTLGHALYALRHEADVGRIYGELPQAEVLDQLRHDPRFAAAPAERPTWRRQLPSFARPAPLNLIIVVEESLGAGFSGRLGGAGITPQLDRWAERGWWFENLYATGTRSARGLEAVVAGFPPSPAQSVLKLPRAQNRFTTLASVLGEAGYRSEFIYGGESHFDNMRGFFLANGFDAVIDQDDYAAPEFRGSWGVSDGDLFARAQARAETLHAQGQRFFSLVFTSSNHTPFEYPQGRVPPVDAEPHTLGNAVHYADHALGRFLDGASRSRYFADTLILVVADHDVRVYGDDIVPIERFRIPGLLLGADLEPRRIASIASQIDLAPTLLSVMGVAADIPFPGYDLTRSLPEFGAAGPAPRALLQFNDVHARLEAGWLDVLLPGGETRRYGVDAARRRLESQAPLPVPARQRLLAGAYLPALLYQTDAYRPRARVD
jgi:phosphoglycerol transferase MdoB-like AlkP superfamily enzyme